MVQALPFIAAAASVAQGVGGLMAGNANRRTDYAQAQEEQSATEAQIRAMDEKARSDIGEQLAAQGSNGLEGGSGTALDALRQSQVNAALDVMNLRRQGVLKARALRAEGDQAATRGRFALLEGLVGAGSSFARMKTDWAQARAGEGS